MDERERPLATATSRALDGRRAIWKIIWGCPLASELWRAMAVDWNIPKLESISNPGPEWLFTLLEPLDDTARMVVLMTMWRSWHVRNEITHNKMPPPTEASRRFLHWYITSLLCINQHPSEDHVKGKMVVVASPPAARVISGAKMQPRWVPPDTGWTKLNTDGSFITSTGAAGGGMILRDDRGEIIYSACRELRACESALEAELAACREGLELALHRTNLSIIVELDSAEAVTLLTTRTRDRSRHHILIEEIQSLADINDSEILFARCSRSQNNISHELAAYSRRTPHTAVWLSAGLDSVVNLAMAEKPP
ncbi:hypothetical protein VPH35_117042 [Triticum aestivum]